MILRLRTTQSTEDKLSYLQQWLRLSSKAAVMRLAISWSLKNNVVKVSSDNVSYDIKEKDGVDYLRLTIFGQNEDLFKLLIENDVRREISDDEFFPTLTSFYIERGVAEMYSEYRYVNDRNKFLLKLIELSEK